MTAFNYPREGFSRVERRGETRKIKGHGDNATVPSLSFSPFFFFFFPPCIGASRLATPRGTPAMNIWIRESHGTGAPVSFPVAGTRQLVLACAIVNEKTTKMKEEGGWGAIVYMAWDICCTQGWTGPPLATRGFISCCWLKFSSIGFFMHLFIILFFPFSR